MISDSFGEGYKVIPKSRNVWDSILKKGGADLLRLNTPTRPIENEYPERKLKSTLKRE